MKLIYLLLTLIVFAIYIYHYNVQEINYYDSFFSQKADKSCISECRAVKPIKFDAVINSKPQGQNQTIVLYHREIQVILPHQSKAMIGKEVTLIGTLTKELTDRKIYKYRLINPEIKEKNTNQNIFYRFYYIGLNTLFAFVDRVENCFDSGFNTLHASVLAGIVFGVRNELSPSFYDALIKTGTVHVIAASGYNVSIISGFCFLLFLRLFSKPGAFITTAFFLLIYVAITGFGEPITRAAIMGLLALYAQTKGKHYQALWSLLVTSGLMLLLKPTLISHVSFLLSVFATAGIILFTKPVQNLIYKGISLLSYTLYKSRLFSVLVHDLSTTTAALIGTFPISLIYFGSFSFISLLANILILWTIPPLMLMGTWFVILFFVSQNAAHWLAMLIKPFLEYFVRIISWLASQNTLAIGSETLNWTFGFGYYILLLSILLLIKKKLAE